MTRPRRGKNRKHKTSTWFSTRQFASYTRRRAQSTKARRRQSAKYRRSANFWHQHTPFEFSKIVIRDVELLWLELNAPQAVITWERVPKCESYPAYQSGEWNGMAHFVRFPEGDKHNAMMFRIEWWNQKV